jgi:hypothetical protein
MYVITHASDAEPWRVECPEYAANVRVHSLTKAGIMKERVAVFGGKHDVDVNLCKRLSHGPFTLSGLWATLRSFLPGASPPAVFFSPFRAEENSGFHNMFMTVRPLYRGRFRYCALHPEGVKDSRSG